MDFIFRCHIRTVINTKKIYRINSIKFNNLYNTFATCGADGKLIIWSNLQKCKLSEISFDDSPNITEIQYSDCGNFLAYSSGNELNSKLNKVQLGINYLMKKEKKGEKIV
jgi:WD40 repeat protein